MTAIDNALALAETTVGDAASSLSQRRRGLWWSRRASLPRVLNQGQLAKEEGWGSEGCFFRCSH